MSQMPQSGMTSSVLCKHPYSRPVLVVAPRNALRFWKPIAGARWSIRSFGDHLRCAHGDEDYRRGGLAVVHDFSDPSSSPTPPPSPPLPAPRSDVEVIHPNANGSYSTLFQRNKAVRTKERSREEMAQRWLEQNRRK